MNSYSDRFEINIDHLGLGNNFVHITSADKTTLVLEAKSIKITLDRLRKEIIYNIVTDGQGTYSRYYDMIIHPFADNFESYIQSLSKTYINFADVYAENFKRYKVSRNPTYMQPYTTLFINDVGGSHLATYDEGLALFMYESFLRTLSKKVFNNLSIEDEVMFFRTSEKLHELLAPIEPEFKLEGLPAAKLETENNYPVIDPDNEFTLISVDSKPSKPSEPADTSKLVKSAPQNRISTELLIKMLKDDIYNLVMKKYVYPNRYAELKFQGRKRVRLYEKNNPSLEEREDKKLLKKLNEELKKLQVKLAHEKEVAKDEKIDEKKVDKAKAYEKAKAIAFEKAVAEARERAKARAVAKKD